MRAFHSNWTKPFFLQNPNAPYRIEPFELLTTALSALNWQKYNGSICMICDTPALEYYKMLGIDFLWNDGIFPLLDHIPQTINASVFWAAGKLFALSAMPLPCVMMDTDFIVWQTLENEFPSDIIAIHAEQILPNIYPDASALSAANGFDFAQFDWSVFPLNTALCYIGNDDFRKYYTETAISFMHSAKNAADRLIYMVFAEQRLLSMCAAKQGLSVATFSDLDTLFGSSQTKFTHTWGFKQQMRENADLLHQFCKRCAERLCKDFPKEAQKISETQPLSPYF